MKLFSKENMHDYLHTLFFMALGCAVYSISLNVFYNPIKLLGGGVTGLAQILHFELGVDISTMIICCNIPPAFPFPLNRTSLPLPSAA